MASTRRIGAESSKTRVALLDATLQLMAREGYAAVTSRRVASEAGLKPQLVHYYFRTMEDLFLAVFRRGAEAAVGRQERALASPQPLWALWELSNDPEGNAFTIEFAALANHRKAIKSELARYGEQFRIRQREAVTKALLDHGVDPDDIQAATVARLMTRIALVLQMEDGLGMSGGQEEVRTLVETWLTRIEGERSG